ncbi:RING/U-box superfamily protein [Artemisia annua]|uniref:RING/U-box superfamily protein n=1 Tax=Artemisia annua TaxID=35608 RepID=A0A2U1P861_ARTAN|nr:RING/U-box superfamily protein [Artemisia annua]
MKLQPNLSTLYEKVKGYCLLNMWGFGSNTIAGTSGPKSDSTRPGQASSDCSDDEISLNNSREEGLECPICWESFNIVENVPYVLWCGHTLCKNCVLGLQWAVVKLPTLPIQLPFFISCPWCNLLSFRLVYKGVLKFPRKNYFLLWMVESLNGDRVKSHTSSCADHIPVPTWSWTRGLVTNPVIHINHVVGPRVREPNRNDDSRAATRVVNGERLQSSIRKSLIFFVHLTAKFPLVFLFLLIVLYAIPASAIILAVYILITILFALPSFLVLYFAYPSLDWLMTIILLSYVVMWNTWTSVTSYRWSGVGDGLWKGIMYWANCREETAMKDEFFCNKIKNGFFTGLTIALGKSPGYLYWNKV